MGCQKLTYYESKTTLGENWKIFSSGIEKTASSSIFCKDYYAGGSIMPGRSFSSSDYRYGLMGYEKDDEIKGNGNSYDMGARLYDPRLVRVPTIDPLFRKFPNQSPYVFAGNNPVYYVDKDGEEKTTYITTIENGKKSTIQVVDKDYVVEKTEFYLPDNGGHLLTVDWDYNVVEFITIDVDNNKVFTTGEQLLDKSWDDGLEFLDSWGATKQGSQAGGNPLVADASIADLPGNASKYLPTAKNPGKEIDVTDLLGGRGGASLAGKAGQIVEVLKTGFDLGQSLGEIINSVGEYQKQQSRRCEHCKQNFVVDENGKTTRTTTNKPAQDTVEVH